MNALARLAMLGVFLACAPFAALPAQDAKVLVEQLGDANERAAARAQLLAMGPDAVPALAAALRDAADEQLAAVLEILTDLGPAAGAAVPQLVAREKAGREARVVRFDVVATIAELAPWCEGDAAPDWPAVTDSLLEASMARSRPTPSTDEIAVLERFIVRSSFARDTSTDELIVLVDGRRAFHREIAIELLGRRGRAAMAALPALERALAMPEPRVLLTERTVRLHTKTARALLAIAPDSEIAARARDVLEGKPPARSAEKLPARARARIDELVRELEAPKTRAAAIANLAALGAPAAEPVAAALTAGSDADTQRAVLAVLRELGPGAAAALPQVVTSMRDLAAENVVDAFEIIVAAMPRSTDVVPDHTARSGEAVFVCERWVKGLDDAVFARFTSAADDYHARNLVDANGTWREFGGWFADPRPRVREQALIAAAQRGEAARPLLPRIGEMMRVDDDRTQTVQRAAARAVLAIAPPGDPLIAEACKVLGEPAPK